MHELLLHGSVPVARHHQMLSVLAGLTATPSPPRVLERHFIYRPERTPSSQPYSSVKVGASQQIDAGKTFKKSQQALEARLVRIVQELDASADNANAALDVDEMDGIEDAKPISNGNHVYEDESIWTLHVDETPEPSVRTHVSRKTSRQIFNSIGDAETYIAQHELKVVSQYLLVGHRFVHNNLFLKLYQCMQLLPHDRGGDSGPDTRLSGFERRPLDSSGAFVLESSAAVEDGTDATLMSSASAMLLRLKDHLDGCIELKAVERLSMDTRAR